jgi:hypothetical protein
MLVVLYFSIKNLAKLHLDRGWNLCIIYSNNFEKQSALKSKKEK